MSVATLSSSPYSSSHLPAALEQGSSNQLVPGSPISPATAASLRLAAAARSRSPSQFVPEVERSSGYAVSPLLRRVLKGELSAHPEPCDRLQLSLSAGNVQQLHHRKRHSDSPSPSEHASKRLCNNSSPRVPIFFSQKGPPSPGEPCSSCSQQLQVASSLCRQPRPSGA